KSRSGVLWNNQEKPIARKPASANDIRAGAFQGNMRLRRPLKPRNAGESKGRDHWNNDGVPLDGTAPPRSVRTHALFQGNIKGGKIGRASCRERAEYQQGGVRTQRRRAA